MRIILIGFMGTGKSAVGRILARRLRFRFFDTDAMIERATRMKIPVFVRKRGWPPFRKREKEVLRRALQGDRIVVSTGGGVVLDAGNRKRMRQRGLVIHLAARPQTILKRIGRSRARPLLAVDHPLREIRRLLRQRARFYRQADRTIPTDGKSPRQVAGAILPYLSLM